MKKVLLIATLLAAAAGSATADCGCPETGDYVTFAADPLVEADLDLISYITVPSMVSGGGREGPCHVDNTTAFDEGVPEETFDYAGVTYGKILVIDEVAGEELWLDMAEVEARVATFCEQPTAPTS